MVHLTLSHFQKNEPRLAPRLVTLTKFWPMKIEISSLILTSEVLVQYSPGTVLRLRSRSSVSFWW